MKINSAGSEKHNSLYHYTLYLLGLDSSDTTSLPVVDFIRSANSWLRRLVFLIWKSSAQWEWDDSNQTDLPIATTDLVADQQDYSLPSTAIDVQRVEVLDDDGNYQPLVQFDKSQVSDIALTEYYETAGLPIFYDIIGSSLFLYPKPSSTDVTTTDGLKLYLARDIDAFTTTDTSQEPGIQPWFHPYISYGGAKDYAISKNLDANKVSLIDTEIVRYEVAIKEHAVKRNKDFKTRIRPKSSSSI